MKKRILFIALCFLCTLQIQAQSEKQVEINKLVWEQQNDFTSLMEVAPKWKDESAVYLYKSVTYFYNRPTNSIQYTKITRNRVKLLDQAAVKEFSEFNYEKDNSYYRRSSRVTNTFLLGVKIIKPDGKEIMVAIDTEEIETEEGKKLAIPNLEKGDILDYYFYSNIIVGENDLFQYEAVENVIGENYPIMNYEFTLETEKDFFISFNTYNNAPELALKSIQKKKRKKRVYNFSMKDVDKNDFPRWFYPLVELPSYKFNVLFARTRRHEKNAYAFIPKDVNTVKTTVSKEEIFNLYKDKFSPFGDLYGIERFLKKKEFSSNTEKVTAVFYYMRHAYFSRYIEAFLLNEANILYPYEYYGRKSVFLDQEKRFVRFFAAFLKDNKVDYEILVATKRFNGTIEDLLLETNLNFIVKVNTETPLYIEYFNQFTTVNLISPLLENTKAYALKVVKRKRIEDIETIQLPKSTYEDNNTLEQLSLTIADDFSSINVHRKSVNKGHNKIDEQKRRLNFYDYIDEDHEKYKTTPILDKVRSKRKRTQYKKEYNALLKKMKEKNHEKLKGMTAGEYNLEIDDYSYKILNNGRYGKGDTFQFEEDFTIKSNLIKRAGKNYIINIGRLIGEQVDINKKQQQRTNNIYTENPRSYSNEITITIPEGYTVSGLKNLTKDVNTKTGGFTSNASINGDKLIIKTNKYYVNYYEPNSNWPEMLSFLDIAYQFTQEKILLKKVN